MDKLGQPKEHVPVFVGSTYEDLKEHRSAVIKTLHQLETSPHGMEYFGSKPGNPKEECLKDVRSCKAYIGLFAMRYGSIDEETGKSMTHLEYEEAIQLKLPIFIYLIDEDNQSVLAKHVETGDKAKLLKELKSKLKTKHIVSFFTTPDNLAKCIALDLPPILQNIGVAIEPGPTELLSTDAKETLVQFKEPVMWKMGRFLVLEFNNKGRVHRVRKFGIHGENITSSPIKKMDGYIEVDRTGERFPIKLHEKGNIVEVDKFFALPPDEQISISVFFSNTINDYSAWKGFEPSEFIDRYAPFTFITIFNGRHYKHFFSIKKIQENIDMRVSAAKQTERGVIFKS